MIKAIKQKKLLYVTAVIALVLIAAGISIGSLFSLAAFALSAAAMLLLPINDAYLLLFALMPFANIFKLSPSSTSLFTLLELLIAFYGLIKLKKLNALFLTSLLFLCGYFIICSGADINLLSVIKTIVGFLLIYCTIQHLKRDDLSHLAYLFSASVSAMLLLCQIPRYMNSVIPYLGDLDYLVTSSGVASDTLRSSGFLGDPNYCALMIIAALSFLCVLYYYKSIGNEFWLFGAILAPLGFLTYSKSYFLCITVLAVVLILFVLFPKHKRWAVISLFGLTVLMLSAFSGKIAVFNSMIDRFSSGDLTTGRSELNLDYLTYITSDAKVLFFGEGLASERYFGARNNVHNIYIEVLYKLGIIGTILYVTTLFLSLKNTMPKMKKNVINYIPAVFMVTMFFFLAGVLNYSTPFYIIIAYIAFYFHADSAQNKAKEEGKNI